MKNLMAFLLMHARRSHSSQIKSPLTAIPFSLYNSLSSPSKIVIKSITTTQRVYDIFKWRTIIEVANSCIKRRKCNTVHFRPFHMTGLAVVLRPHATCRASKGSCPFRSVHGGADGVSSAQRQHNTFVPLLRSTPLTCARVRCDWPVCNVDGVLFRTGDPIPTEDPCESCKCRPPGFACVLRECEVKPHCKAVRRDGQCCPEYQCGELASHD